MAQVLPIAAVLSVVWIVEVRPRWLAMSLSLVCLVVGSVNLIVGALDARPWIRPVAAYLGVCPEKGYSIYCPPPLSATERRLRKGDSPEREILAAVLEDPNCRGSRTCRLWYINIGRSREDCSQIPFPLPPILPRLLLASIPVVCQGQEKESGFDESDLTCQGQLSHWRIPNSTDSHAG